MANRMHRLTEHAHPDIEGWVSEAMQPFVSLCGGYFREWLWSTDSKKKKKKKIYSKNKELSLH